MGKHIDWTPDKRELTIEGPFGDLMVNVRADGKDGTYIGLDTSSTEGKLVFMTNDRVEHYLDGEPVDRFEDEVDDHEERMKDLRDLVDRAAFASRVGLESAGAHATVALEAALALVPGYEA